MRNIVTSILLITLAGVASANDSFLRVLQNTTRGGRVAPKVYDDDLKVVFNANLGCGACIRFGYVFCIPGAEGSDTPSWGAGKKAVCCKDDTCPQVKDTANFNCSNSYTDPMLAKSICPFRKASCGNNTAFDFDAVGQKQDINITLNKGETCTYQIEADCGLPAFKPNDTTGFDIETIDYDDEDIDSTGIKAAEQHSDDDGHDHGKPARKQFGSDKKPPRPPKKIVPVRTDKKGGNSTNQTNQGNSTNQGNKKGPQARRFNPDETKGKAQKFKGGARDGNEKICKKRYQQISITALGDVNSTSRILQTDNDPYVMTLEIGTEDFSGAVSKMVALTFVVVFSAVSLIF